MRTICARKNCLLINFWKLLFWIGIKYEKYRFSLSFGFDPYPSNEPVKEIPGYEMLIE